MFFHRISNGGGQVDNTNEKLKIEIAKELGLWEKINELGWKSLTSKETGKIGGLVTKKKKKMNAEEKKQ